MSWKHYNAEAKKIEVVRTLVGDMEQFGAIVMAEDTWNVILQVSECVPCEFITCYIRFQI